MQIAIPLIESIQDNIELRYALRSVEMYLTGVSSITIIGYKPSWLRNVTHIPHDAAINTEWKEKNIYDKLCLMRGKFLYMNDDHFLLHQYNARKFPYYYEGTLADKLNKTFVRNVYRKTIENTMQIEPHKPFFDIHCPIIIDTDYFCMKADWNNKFGYCLKTLYTSWDKAFVPATDLKLTAQFDEQQIRQLIADRLWFSTSEAAWNEPMIKVMNELYPKKSKHEC